MKKKSTTYPLDDFLPLAESVLDFLAQARQTAATHMAGHRETLIAKLDLVGREEFDAAFTMLKKIRSTQDGFERRLQVLEGKKEMSSPRKRPAAKQLRPKS